ncbi:MAG: hypothetical protein J0L70_21375 [Leptolyngbya sp. UWPOB_LEPTO1]|nr:hypothetical protein [Leptolyngbya sp. UWPOB_LEPTO1]
MTNPLKSQFTEVLTLIQVAQRKVLATTNQKLIKLYWSIGKYISNAFSACETLSHNHIEECYNLSQQIINSRRGVYLLTLGR